MTDLWADRTTKLYDTPGTRFIHQGSATPVPDFYKARFDRVSAPA
jgi:hypothetical protein